ncbi:MAG: 7-carboxy-7-deazaguanine synthase QueE [Bacteroidetes bacterium]|nr:7-carboxy-7-deazaguanine synthase QueE [Bacteroidota bacterium]
MSENKVLPVMEHFYTLQGEGFFSGHAAYFIRLGGCDVGCVWCDVKESWEADNHPKMTIEQIVSSAKKYQGRIAVITGGEPYIHDISALIFELHEAGFRVHIETSGSHPPSGKADWITLSPKKFKAPLPTSLSITNELKVVIYHSSDLVWAEQFAALVSEQCKLFLQPEWSKREKMTPLIIDYIQQHPQWQLSLQTHKYINIP